MNWQQLLAAFINGFVVYGVVQGLMYLKPILQEKYPWAWTLLGAILGILIPIVANLLTSLLGVPIDLNPILNVFAGVMAVMMTWHRLNLKKITELRRTAGLEK
jgi:uncharacterized membrane protein